jgi:hypothetical protein
MAKATFDIIRKGGKLQGFEMVLKNLELVNDNMKKDALRGMIKGAAIIRRSTEKNPPLTPLDTGNLRASWFVVTALSVARGQKVIFKPVPGKPKKQNEMAADHAKVIADASQESQKDKRLVVIMGYSARYALPVHERIDPKIEWKRTLSGPRWFEIAFKSNIPLVYRTIAKEIKIKKTGANVFFINEIEIE